MYGKLINNKLIVQNNKKIFCIELNEVEKRALEMQEVKEFEIQNVKNFSKLEDLKFLDISSVVYYIVDGTKVFKNFCEEKGYESLKVRFIGERKSKKEFVVKSFSEKIGNGAYRYKVYTIKPKEGFIIFDDKMYNKEGGLLYKLDEYLAQEIYKKEEFVIEKEEEITVGKTNHDHTDDIAASYDLLSD